MAGKNGKWKLTNKRSSGDAKNLIIHGYYLIKASIIVIFEKLTSKELHQILISKSTNKVISVTYFEIKFNSNNLDWKKLVILPRLTTYNLRSFQYKILRNILFLNKNQYLFGITKSPLCSYCNAIYETLIHLFRECNPTKFLWLQLNRCFHSGLTFPILTSKAAILGLFNDSVSNTHLINHILLLYKFRNKDRLNINELLTRH